MHETLNVYQLFRKEHPEEKSTIILDIKFCLDSLSDCFFSFRKTDQSRLLINWKEETPESTFLLGEKLVTTFLKSHNFRNTIFHETGNSFLLHLRRDLNLDTFFPCYVTSNDTLSIDCFSDSIPQNHLIIEHLNSIVGTKYHANHGDNLARIQKLTKEGYTFLDFFTVIDKKAKEWMGTEYEQYLCPETLFSDKFEKYLNQNILRKTQVPGSYGGSNRRDASTFTNETFIEEE